MLRCEGEGLFVVNEAALCFVVLGVLFYQLKLGHGINYAFSGLGLKRDKTSFSGKSSDALGIRSFS